jgi:ABC-type multidrug transport system fused ATPase/permease subunit
MEFFDTTPSGVIINRCINDVDKVDYVIPWMIGFFLNAAFNFVGAFILTAFVSPLVLVFIIIGFASLSKSFKNYIKTAIELKRIVQISMSPMISRCSEFIEGVTVIRNYHKRSDFMKKYAVRADVHHNAYLHDELANTWLRWRVELMLSVFVGFMVLTVIFNKEYP